MTFPPSFHLLLHHHFVLRLFLLLLGRHSSSGINIIFAVSRVILSILSRLGREERRIRNSIEKFRLSVRPPMNISLPFHRDVSEFDFPMRFRDKRILPQDNRYSISLSLSPVLLSSGLEL